MATTKPIISIVLDEATLQRVEDFQFKHRIGSRSKAVSELIKIGLKSMEEFDEIPDDLSFDATEEIDKLMDILGDMKKKMESMKKGD